jgi:hypothetical protein
MVILRGSENPDDRRRVDVHYRDLDAVEQEMAASREGRFRIEPLMFHLAGILASSVAAKWRLRLLRFGCDCQHAAEQGGPFQGPHALRMQGPQRRVVAGVERDGFFPQHVLACQP